MSNKSILEKIDVLREYEAIMDEASAIVESIRDELKKHLDSLGVEELEVNTHIIRYTSVLSNRFDSTAFKKEHAEMYKMYTKQIASRRFSIT